MAETELRPHRNIEIFARVMVVRLRWPACWALSIKDRDLTGIVRPGHGELSARVHGAGENAGQCSARLRAKKPGREHGIGLIEKPRIDERPPGRQRHDHRLPEAE